MPATTPATRWRVLGWSGSPKRSAFRLAIGPRAHGEDVAHDAADAGRRALVGLDVGGVVVALHLEDARRRRRRCRPRRRSRPGPGSPAGPWSGSLLQPHAARICRSSARSTSPRRCRARSASARGPGFRAAAGIRPASARARRPARREMPSAWHAARDAPLTAATPRARQTYSRHRCPTAPDRQDVRDAASGRARCRSRCRCRRYCCASRWGWRRSSPPPAIVAIAERDAALALEPRRASARRRNSCRR